MPSRVLSFASPVMTWPVSPLEITKSWSVKRATSMAVTWSCPSVALYGFVVCERFVALSTM